MPRIRAENIESHKALTRREILEAAHALLAEAGSADISVAEVAHEAGIGRTTLYEYFRDRDDLIASLVEETLPEVVVDIIAGVPPSLPPEERLAELAVATVRFVVRDPVLGLILHRELPRLSRDAQERVLGAHADLSVEMVGAYRAGVESGRFRPVAADIAGRFIQDLIMAAARVLIDAPSPEARLPEVERELVAFLFGGLRPVEDPTRP